MSLPYLQPYLGLSNGLNTLHAAGGAGGIGGWVELARTTLGGASSTIDVTSFADKRYYMVLANNVGRSAVSDNGFLRMGNGSFDTGSNYANRRSANGGADATTTSQDKMFGIFAPTNTTDFYVGYIANYSSKEKLLIAHQINQNTAGAANAPTRNETVHKHAFTSNPIDRISFLTNNADTYNSGGEVVVLGWDPLDSHTNNFWEELASANATSNEITSGTITAKKYLWVQYYIKPTGGTVNGKVHFNNDTGSNYADRLSPNGGADSTHTSFAYLFGYVEGTGTTTGSNAIFGNMFIVNNASNEKLIIQHVVDTTSGAGNAPSRIESVTKWTNTSNQITQIDIDRDGGTGTYDSTSIIKVWGAN
jgi:hypothetical protein